MLTSVSTIPISSVDGEALVEFSPVRAYGQKRRLYVTKETWEMLRAAPKSAMFPSVEAEKVLSAFYAGFALNGSLKSAKDCEIERLENVGEIWAFCFRKPRPGWRLFGKFIERDVFVAAAMYDRHALAGDNYSRLAIEAINDLNARFPKLPVHSGAVLGDYMTGPIMDLD